MKSFNVILETTIEADTQEEAEKFANEKLSIVDHDAALYDVTECRIVEAE